LKMLAGSSAVRMCLCTLDSSSSSTLRAAGRSSLLGRRWEFLCLRSQAVQLLCNAIVMARLLRALHKPCLLAATQVTGQRHFGVPRWPPSLVMAAHDRTGRFGLFGLLLMLEQYGCCATQRLITHVWRC
jgi:hypothetical protein